MKVQRFPRYDDSTRQALLEEQAFPLIGQSEQVRLKLGRIFLALKRICKRQRESWEEYFGRKFGSKMTLRTAQNHMRFAKSKARKDKAKNETVSFSPAEDGYAKAVRKATSKATLAASKAKYKPPIPSAMKELILDLLQVAPEAANEILNYLHMLREKYQIKEAA